MMDFDGELDKNAEYRRLLAELSPADRVRLIGTDFNLQRVLASKREHRRLLAGLSASKKLRLLDELRNRAELLRGKRRSPSPKLGERFGGRSTASGVAYEVRIGALIGAKMLSGSCSPLWEGVSGGDIRAISLQTPDIVDDIVVEFAESDLIDGARGFVSVKHRSTSIPLTDKSTAFVQTVDAFVGQFLKLSTLARERSRLVWAIPSSAGKAAAQDLRNCLTRYRGTDAGSIDEFLRGSRSAEKRALTALLAVVDAAWRTQSGVPATAQDIRDFLHAVYVETYDFGLATHSERVAIGDLANHVVADSAQAELAWITLERVFAAANEQGLRLSVPLLRRALVENGIRLNSPPDFSQDTARLHELTDRNLRRIEEHTMLPFAEPGGEHIQRGEELSALLAAAKSGHLLITGEPGCGKTGLIHSMCTELIRAGSPVVLLLAEEIFGCDWKGSANLPGFNHGLDEILTNMPFGEHGYLVTDALDAVRDAETQRRLRRLLGDVMEGKSDWRVIASVREFDLKHGRELRTAFPGSGVPGYTSGEFNGVAHFHLSGLSDVELDHLAARRSEIGPFINSARASQRSGEIHRSPFYLRLAADLLRNGVTPVRLADWNNPALLLRKFWEARVEEGAGAGERQVVLAAVCRRAVETRRMAVSLKELSFGSAQRTAVEDLRSRGILQSPTLRHGIAVGIDEIRFTHHLLHDYAIARSLIPETPALFTDFALREPLLPIFYRQSFLFALEELWDVDVGRNVFWECALRMEDVPRLHGITRILAPVLAANRVELIADLQPLLSCLSSSADPEAPAEKALRHLAAGLQDANANAIRVGAPGWSAFAHQLASLLRKHQAVEAPLVHILARINKVVATPSLTDRQALNRASRALLALHIDKEVSKGWRYAALVAIETICRTFDVAPSESEEVLLGLLTPERLAFFPHDDLHDLANNLHYLSEQGDPVVMRLFEASFAREPQPGDWEQFGSVILPMQIQSSDQWNGIHYVLAEYYEARGGRNAVLMTHAACVAWNAVGRRRGRSNVGGEIVLATVWLRGRECKLLEDYSHIWGRSFEHEENRILSHFENLLKEWAASGDSIRLEAALNTFASQNRTALMWTVFLETGAEHPSTLGVLLEDVLKEPSFLTHPDYAFAGTALLGALHSWGDTQRRRQLENLVLELPNTVRAPVGATPERTTRWIEHGQNRLLGALVDANIIMPEVRELWRARHEANALQSNTRPVLPEVTSHTFSDKEVIEERGVSFKDPVNEEMFRLREALKPLLGKDGQSNVTEIDRGWPVITECEAALKRYAGTHKEMVEELWGHLVGALENVARCATWPKKDPRWKVIRRVLLQASFDPVPLATVDDKGKEDHWPSWGWPSPRLDAARGLPFVAFRLGRADKDIALALRRLCRDQSHPLRFNLVGRLSILQRVAPRLMWDLIDDVIEHESKFSVLDALVISLDHLWLKPKQVLSRLRVIAQKAAEGAPAENNIHETLAQAFLFHFLRSGDSESGFFINKLIERCDAERANAALLPQLHAIRAGGWLIAGDADSSDEHSDEVRARVWTFLSELLSVAQKKLQHYRDEMGRLHESGEPDPTTVKLAQQPLQRVHRLVDGIAMQLFFGSGAHDAKTNKPDGRPTTPAQLQRFWREASPLFSALAAEPHPHTAHQVVQTLYHLLPCAPREVFLLAAESIQTSAKAGFQHESLAVSDVVRLIQRALADHRDIFHDESNLQSDSACLAALLSVLDLFVEAGWAEARQLTHRLEEIYR